jgi:hypothetical protein
VLGSIDQVTYAPVVSMSVDEEVVTWAESFSVLRTVVASSATWPWLFSMCTDVTGGTVTVAMALLDVFARLVATT